MKTKKRTGSREQSYKSIAEMVECHDKEHITRNVNLPRKWSGLSYAGESRVPQGLDPTAGSWPLFYFRKAANGAFTTLDGEPVSFEIQNPDNFNFDRSLQVVQWVQKNLTPQQRTIAEYWGEGPATKQWTPIIDRLIDTYGVSPVYAARVLGVVQAAINDAFVITWYFKYIWDVPRPAQLDQNLATAICTPKFPSYPSGHSVISGVAEVILSYFFPPEAEKLTGLAEENSISRLYGGVHFVEDIDEGLRLGRQIGRIVVEELIRQGDSAQTKMDIPITEDRNADLPPPPYEQVIPFFPLRVKNCNLPLLPERKK